MAMNSQLFYGFSRDALGEPFLFPAPRDRYIVFETSEAVPRSVASNVILFVFCIIRGVEDNQQSTPDPYLNGAAKR